MKSIFKKKSIQEIIKEIKLKKISCAEIIHHCFKIIKKYEPIYHAWVRFDEKKSIKNAKKSDNNYKNLKNNILEGIPFGSKDIFNTRDFSTSMGSSIYKNFTPGNNARIIDNLIDLGAQLIGKTVTSEFAVHKLNKTLNPHNQKKTPGTSSSGSAVAVATGMVPFALATQTAGSIIRPASFCGVWGMKPTFGLIPRTGVLKTTDTLDTVGFFSSNLFNLREILEAVRVKGLNYPFVYKNIERKNNLIRKKEKKWKIGFVKTHTWSENKSYVKESIKKLCNDISNDKDFVIEEVKWPKQFEEIHNIHSVIYNKSLSYYFQNEAKRGSKISDIMNEMIYSGNSISKKKYLSALNLQAQFVKDIDKLIYSYDFLISNSTASSAPVRGKKEIRDPSLIWTLGYLPSVNAPLFKCHENMPFGAQFFSKRWCDYDLLTGLELLSKKSIIASHSLEISN